MRKITKLLTLMIVTMLSLSFLTANAQQSLSISSKAPPEARISESPVNYSKSQIANRNIVISEDFESGTFPPAGWTKIDFHTNPTSNWHEDTEAGNTFPQVLYNDANLMDEWLITPFLDLTSYTDLQLKFKFFTSYYWLVDPFDGADFMVKVSTDGGTNWTQIWVEEDFGVFNSFEWYDVILPFNAYAGLSGVKIAFHWYGDDGAQTRFDDVILEEPPACPPPTGLYAESITSTTALAGWTPGGSETLWNIAVGLPDFDPDVPSEWVAGENGTNKNPWPAEGLIPGTTYEFYAQADCGAKEESSWAGPFEFTTLCEFECPIGSIAETEACGDTINNGCNLVTTQTFESVNPGDVICGTVWAEGGFRDTDWFELILVEHSQVIIHAYAETELLFGLLAGTDPTNPDCDSVSGINPFALTEICTPVTLDLGVLLPGTHWFFAGLPVFDGFPCDLNYWIEFEVIEVDCLPPTDLDATTLSTTSVELTWTAGGDELEWEVAVVPAGDPEPTSGTLLDVTNYTATSLTFGQSYDAFVRSICVTKSESLWVKTTFTVNYCLAGPTSADDSDLFRVQITGPDVNFDHNVGCTGILGIQDFTGLGAIQLQQGVEYTMTITLGTCGGSYGNFGRAWIDYNKNVTFNHPDELLGTVTGSGTIAGNALSFNFTVPLDAELGESYMRVMQYETGTESLVTPCATYSWGSVHEYLVEVLPPPATPVFSVLPTDWNFGNNEVGEQSAPKVFTISNAGPGTLTVSAPTLDNNVDFTLDYEATDYPAELEGTETVIFNVVFHPSSTGEKFGEVSISYDDTESIATVDLYGTGVVRPAGSTCANPYPVTLPLVDYEDNTEAYGNDYLSSWVTPPPSSNYLHGYDFVAEFTLAEAGYLSGSVAGSWTGLFILEDCPDPTTPAARLAFVGSSTGGSISDVYLDAGTYFAIVSTWPTPNFTDFTLNLSFVPLPSCPVPTAPTATAITGNSATLSWNEIGSATLWDIEFGVSPYTFTGTPTISGVTNPYSLGGLDPETAYQYRVRSDCGGEESDWSVTHTFTTLCETFMPPFLEDFNSTPFPPACWNRYSGILTNSSTLTTGSQWFHHYFGNVVSGSENSAYINIYATRNHWLVTPSIDLGTGAVDYQIAFDIALTPWVGTDPVSLGPDDYVAVVISTDNGATWSDANVLIDWDATDVISPTGDNIVVSLAGYTGIVRIGFYAERAIDATVPDLRFYVDNVNVDELAPSVPENLNIDSEANLDDCFDATNTIIVTNSTVPNGSSAYFKAGVNIIFGDGFVVESGGYMHADITNDYCSLPLAMVASEDVIIPEEIPAIPVQESFFKVFPNPTTSTFKLELLGADEAAKINVEIYGMMGERVFQDVLFGGSQYEFDLSDMPKGIYFIRVLIGDEMGIEKVIKQ